MSNAETIRPSATNEDSMMQSVADAMRDAAGTASDHAAKVRASVADAGPRALRTMSRATYTSAYVISYGVVYSAVFAVRLLPQENAFMYGMHDGAVAAIDALKRT
jgi:hypothetical protein